MYIIQHSPIPLESTMKISFVTSANKYSYLEVINLQEKTFEKKDHKEKPSSSHKLGLCGPASVWALRSLVRTGRTDFRV